MVDRMRTLQHQNRVNKLKIEHLRAKLAAMIEMQSLELDEDTSCDIQVYMKHALSDPSVNNNDV